MHTKFDYLFVVIIDIISASYSILYCSQCLDLYTSHKIFVSVLLYAKLINTAVFGMNNATIFWIGIRSKVF